MTTWRALVDRAARTLRRREAAVAASPEETLFRTVAVLRASGARITRYDVEEGTLEARLARWRRPVLVRFRAVAVDAGSRVTVEGEGWGWGGAARRVLAYLVRPEGEQP